jgi:UDP-3-O-[3-hydroxymyristoyl] glucosamine N-acyltransferase
VHLGHGVVLGENCLLAAQVGIGGKTVVGDRVVMYGQVGIINSLLIEDDVVILAQSGVTKNLKAKTTYFGTPAAPSRDRLRELAALRKLGKG